MQIFWTIILFLTGSLIYPAAGPSQLFSTSNVGQSFVGLPQTPQDAAEFLNGSSVDDIFALLPEDAHAKNEAVLVLIEKSSLVPYSCPGKHSNETVLALCEKTKFSNWERISNKALEMFPSLRVRVMDELARTNNKKRIYEIAEWIGTQRLGCGYIDIAVACFKADRETCFMPGCLHKTLIESFIYDATLFDAQKLGEGCAGLTEDEFSQTVHRLIERWGFKDHLWRNRVSLMKIDHQCMVVLQNIVEEMEERIERWAKTIDPKKRNQHIARYRNHEPLHMNYLILMHEVLKNERLNRTHCAILLEMCRNFYTSYEYHTNIGWEFGTVLLRLAQYGIRPTMRLFPHDPADTRTLFSKWLFYFIWDYLDLEHVLFKDVVALLTEKEFDAFIVEKQGTPEFNKMLKMGKWQMTHYKSYEGKWEEPEDINVVAK